MRPAWRLLAWGLAGCTPAASLGPRVSLAPAYPAHVAALHRPLPPGWLVGKVQGWRDQSRVPAAGATVRIAALGLAAPCDAQGLFGFEGLPPGQHLLQVEAGPTGKAQELRIVASPTQGLGRVLLVQAPQQGGPQLSGVVVDPRGATVPGGVVECSDVATGARWQEQADEEGRYEVKLPPSTQAPPRLVSLSGHGQSPGGLRLEATRIAELSLVGASSVTLGLDAFEQAKDLEWVARRDRVVRLRASGLPRHADELALRLVRGNGHSEEVVPTFLQPPEVEAEFSEAPMPGDRLELRSLGLVPLGSAPPSLGL